MARQISATALAKLAQTHGNEPIILIEVDWTPGATPKWYGDRTVNESIPGKILDVGNLDNIVGVSNNDSSQQIDLILDDTDGSIKAIFDGTDIHKRPARVYQWFDGLGLDDKFLLFAGKVSSPISWDERDRTVKFSIVSQLEDKEVGFSPEEGQFEWLPSALVGQTWPMIFGTVLDCPALQINEAVTGTILCGVGLVAGLDYLTSGSLYSSGSNIDMNVSMALARIAQQLSAINCAQSCWSRYDADKEAELRDQANELRDQRSKIGAAAAAKKQCAEWERQRRVTDVSDRGEGCNPIQVLGGEDFPQDRLLTIEINGALFTGHFSGQDFYIQSRSWPDGEEEADNRSADEEETCPYTLPTGGDDGNNQFDYRIAVPCGCGNQFAQFFGSDNCLCRSHGFIIVTDTGARASRRTDEPIAQQFWAEPGATVRIYSDEPITYIVASLYTYWPGTVLAVKAYKDFPGERRLVDVPSSYYTIENVAYGDLRTVQITTQRPLSSYHDQGWTDDLYVTFESHIAVGPDMIDTLVYLIQHYTDLSYDNESFEAVRIQLEPFPVNFPVLERKNTVQILQEIAFQARCALWLSNGVFYIKYLPEEPDSDDTITVSDVDAENSIRTELTSTEDIITKMRIKWRMRWSPGVTDRAKDRSEKMIILRHNVARYGIQEASFDWYIYNQPDIIYKCATFWLIRKSNTWKRMTFSAFLNKLNLETFDCVTLDFTRGYVADGAIKALVEEASYNSATNRIDFSCLVPVKAGQMEKYDWFWPAGLPIHMTWPPPDEITAGDAGGGGEGMSISGALPIGYFEDWGDDIVIVGGPNVVFRPQSDWGDRTPTDVGFEAQSIGILENYATITNSLQPRLNLRTYLAEPTAPIDVPELSDAVVIDIRKTHIVDSDESPDRYGVLSDVLYGINDDGKLMLTTEALIADDDHEQGEIFDFKWADDYELWAAGTAFLRDD